MRLKNLNFETWSKNHPDDHDAKWCRELYPYHIFRNIDFSHESIGISQIIILNNISYAISIEKIEIQNNRRYRTTFNMTTLATEHQNWMNRSWNTVFQIVYSTDYDFITIFTKKDDPSKYLVTKFMKGSLERIKLYRSLAVSELLFRTLILHISEEIFPYGEHNKTFNSLDLSLRESLPTSQYHSDRLDYTPIYSVERNIWISYAFNEEKAHRIAFHNANQCTKFWVIYCNPTLTQHQRCQYDNTQVISLYEFANLFNMTSQSRYYRQIRFLQNHLNYENDQNIHSILNEIENPTQEEYSIRKSDLMEAFAVIKIVPKNEIEAFHCLVSFNLINAWVSKKRIRNTKLEKEKIQYSKLYSFKKQLCRIMETYISQPENYLSIFIEGDMVLIECFGFQFTFRNIYKSDIIVAYEICAKNREIKWKGKKLQPIAPLLLSYSRRIQFTTSL